MGWCAKGVEAKWNSHTSMRTMSLMECVGSAKVRFITDEQFQLLLRKGVYPYEYVDDWEKFKENHLLPPPPPPPQSKHSTLVGNW